MTNQILSEEFRRMQKLAGILTESHLNEEEINFKDADQYADFLQNKTKEELKSYFIDNKKGNYSACNLAIVLKANKMFCPFLMQVSVTDRMMA
jgi:hypothetical protein